MLVEKAPPPEVIKGAPGVENIVSIRYGGRGACGYTPAYKRGESPVCGVQALYEIVGSRDGIFHVCTEHALYARVRDNQHGWIKTITTIGKQAYPRAEEGV